MPQDKKTILAAGASGYIGSRLVPRLLDAGYRVRALARNPQKLSGRPWSDHPAFEAVQTDMLDAAAVRNACSGCHAAY